MAFKPLEFVQMSTGIASHLLTRKLIRQVGHVGAWVHIVVIAEMGARRSPTLSIHIDDLAHLALATPDEVRSTLATVADHGDGGMTWVEDKGGSVEICYPLFAEIHGKIIKRSEDGHKWANSRWHGDPDGNPNGNPDGDPGGIPYTSQSQSQSQSQNSPPTPSGGEGERGADAPRLADGAVAYEVKMRVMPAIKTLLGTLPSREHRETADFLGRVVQDELSAGRGAGAFDRLMAAIRDWGLWFDYRSPKFFRDNLAAVMRGDAVGKKAPKKAATVRPGQEWREEKGIQGMTRVEQTAFFKSLERPAESQLTDEDLAALAAKARAEAEADLAKRQNSGKVQIGFTAKSSGNRGKAAISDPHSSKDTPETAGGAIPAEIGAVCASNVDMKDPAYGDRLSDRAVKTLEDYE